MTEEYINLGIEQLDNDDAERALQYFQAAYDLQPDNAEVLFYLGITYSRLEKHEEAAHFYKLSLHYEPNNAETWLNLANRHDD